MQELPQANQGSRLYAKAIIEWHPNGEFAPSYLGDVHQAVIAIHSGLIAQRHVHITLSTQVTLSKPGVNGQDVTMFLLLTHKDIASAKMTHYVNPAGFNGGDCLEEGRIWNPWTRLGHYKNVPGPVFCGFYKRTPAYLGGLAGLSLRLAKPPVLVQPNVEMLQPLPVWSLHKIKAMDSLARCTRLRIFFPETDMRAINILTGVFNSLDLEAARLRATQGRDAAMHQWCSKDSGLSYTCKFVGRSMAYWYQGLNERKGEGDSISAPTQIENSKEVPPTSSKAPAVSNGNLAEKQAGQATHVEASAAHDSSSLGCEGPNAKRQKTENFGSLPNCTAASSSSSSTTALAKETLAVSAPPDEALAASLPTKQHSPGPASLEARMKRLEEALARQSNTTTPASKPSGQSENLSMEVRMTRLEDRMTAMEEGFTRFVTLMDRFVTRTT